MHQLRVRSIVMIQLYSLTLGQLTADEARENVSAYARTNSLVRGNCNVVVVLMVNDSCHDECKLDVT